MYRHRQALMWIASVSVMCGCAPTDSNELDKLGTVSMTIKDAPFTLWIADTTDEQARGLMFVTKEQMARTSAGADRGMIFVFEDDHSSSFWMRNTIIPLDIAYVDAGQKVVKIYTMAPYDDRSNAYPPGAPYRYAIEVNANRFTELGVKAGDTVTIPESIRSKSK